MANIKELRGRINSIAGIAKITKAMEMVASMKLRKAQDQTVAFRPYANEIAGLMAHLAEFVGEDADLPLFRRREVKTTGIFLVSSDRGLCGAYNANVFAELRRMMDELKAENPNRKFKFYVYGKKGNAYLTKRGHDVARYFAEPTLDNATYNSAKSVSDELVTAFKSGEVDEVRIVNTAFISAGKFTPRSTGFLPVVPEENDADHAHKLDYLLEPDAEAIFDHLVPCYLQTMVFDAMLSSLASEHAARRMAMKGATDAATRMGKDLKKIYNRARQESITKELLDIVGGASAVS